MIRKVKIKKRSCSNPESENEKKNQAVMFGFTSVTAGYGGCLMQAWPDSLVVVLLRFIGDWGPESTGYYSQTWFIIQDNTF